jgi:hypothetical protein
VPGTGNLRFDHFHLVADLADAFPQREISRETVSIYVKHLQDIGPAEMEAAVQRLIRTSSRFPTIRELREAVAEASLALPTEVEALALVNGGVRGLHPLVREALEAVGGYHAWRVTDEPGVMRGQFSRIYREMRAARLNEFVVGDALPPAPPVRELTA